MILLGNNCASFQVEHHLLHMGAGELCGVPDSIPAQLTALPLVTEVDMLLIREYLDKAPA